jgi:hypothetical protein
MTSDDDQNSRYRTRLREAVQDAASRAADWDAFHARLDRAVAPNLAALRRRATGGAAAAGGAWFDYAARTALAAVPLGLAAALLLFTYLRSGGAGADDSRAGVTAPVTADVGADSARAAFESVLTGAAAPGAVMAALIPIPSAGYLADAGGLSK